MQLRKGVSTAGRRWALVAAFAALGACAPSLNWREIRPEGSGLVIQLPCRPASHARDVTIQGRPVRMSMHACDAGGATFAVSWFDVRDPAQVAPALEELARAAITNIRSDRARARALPLSVSGSTPQSVSGRWAAEGRLPDDRAVQLQTAVFARGTQVVQASVVGRQLEARDAEPLFAGLRWMP